MSIVDFLFNGSPPPSVNTYGQTSSSMPQWYSDYTQGLLSRANAIAAGATPQNQVYQGEWQAPTTANQRQAWSNVSDLARIYQPGAANNPFNQARDLVQASGNQNALNQYGGAGLNALQNAANYNPFDAGINNLNTASNITFANQRTATPSLVQQYMNPFQNAVVDQVGRTGAESLATNINNLQDRYVSGGGWGGSRMGAGIGNALRQGSRDILGQQAALQSQGYGQALGAAQADLQRQLQGASQLGALGGQQGQLASAASQNLQALGNQYGNFGQSDLARRLQAAQLQGTLGQQQASVTTGQNAALEAAGQSEQQQRQLVNQALQNKFAAEAAVPYNQLSILNSAIRGLQIPTTTMTSGNAPAQNFQPSPFSQVGSALAGLAGASKLFQ